MTDIEFYIDQHLFTRFPALTVWGVRIRKIRDSLTAAAAEEILNRAVSKCELRPETLGENPVISGWREAYAAMGVKPSKFRSSIEALLRRAAKQADISLPIPCVNIYNACSIVSLAPIGGYDVNRLANTTIMLRFARPGSDRFDPIGAEPSAFPVLPGLVVYGFQDEILCWGFNCRDSKGAALTEQSDDGVFFSEAVFDHQFGASRLALQGLARQMSDLGAECGTLEVANSTAPTFKL